MPNKIIKINGIKFVFLEITIVLIIKISANKLNVGGAAILVIKIKNHIKGKIVDQIRVPLVRIILREKFIWYK